jgi:hypothetical protein
MRKILLKRVHINENRLLGAKEFFIHLKQIGDVYLLSENGEHFITSIWLEFS